MLNESDYNARFQRWRCSIPRGGFTYTGKKEKVNEEYKGEVLQSMYVSDVGKSGITVKRIELLPV